MEEYKKLIYDLMNGKLDFKDNPPEECKYVKDEFSMNSQREKCVNRHIPVSYTHLYWGVYVNYNSIRYPKSVHKVCRMKKTILCILTTVL